MQPSPSEHTYYPKATGTQMAATMQKHMQGKLLLLKALYQLSYHRLMHGRRFSMLKLSSKK
jgi:hypothetical protein